MENGVPGLVALGIGALPLVIVGPNPDVKIGQVFEHCLVFFFNFRVGWTHSGLTF